MKRWPVLATIPAAARLTLTWDQGSEMARHNELADRFRDGIFFADPAGPWMRGPNEDSHRRAGILSFNRQHRQHRQAAQRGSRSRSIGPSKCGHREEQISEVVARALLGEFGEANRTICLANDWVRDDVRRARSPGLASRWPRRRPASARRDRRDRCPPATVVLPQTGQFIGADNDPAPRIDHFYRRTDDIDGQPVYRYESSPPIAPST